MSSTPGHLKFAGLVALCMYGIAAVDYLGLQYDWPFWVGLYNDQQLRWLNGMPDWVDGVYAVAVWGGVLGAILLWTAFGGAPLVLFAAAVSVIVVFVYTFVWDYPGLRAIFGWGAVWALLIASLVGLALWLYARRMHRKDVI